MLLTFKYARSILPLNTFKLSDNCPTPHIHTLFYYSLALHSFPDQVIFTNVINMIRVKRVFFPHYFTYAITIM